MVENKSCDQLEQSLKKSTLATILPYMGLMSKENFACGTMYDS